MPVPQVHFTLKPEAKTRHQCTIQIGCPDFAKKKKNSHQCETYAKLDLFRISFACFLRNKIHIFLHILHRFFASTVSHRIVLQRFVYKFFCVLYLILYQTFFFFDLSCFFFASTVLFCIFFHKS